MSKKLAIKSVFDRLAAVPITTMDGTAGLLNTMIWAGQRDEQPDMPGYSKPACFIETVFSAGMPIGRGATSYEVVFRVMIEQQQFNTEGSIDTELSLLDLPDTVHRTLNGFKSEFCSPMYQSGTQLNYTSGNTILTVLEYSCHFVDLVGSEMDTIAGNYIDQVIEHPILTIEETVYTGTVPDDGGNGNVYIVSGSVVTGYGVGPTIWRDGEGLPADTLGNNGDYYLDTLTGYIYGKQAGVYVYLMTLSTGGGGGGTGMTRTIVSVATDTTAGNAALTEYTYLVSGNANITLPTAVGNKNRYSIINVGTGTVSVRFTGLETANGSAIIPFTRQYTAIEFLSNNTNWNIL